MADFNSKTSIHINGESVDRLFDSLETDLQHKLRILGRQPLFFQKWKCIESSVANYDDRDIDEVTENKVFTYEQMEEQAILYVHPKHQHCYVRVDFNLNVTFLYNTGVFSDYPFLHRFLGPAVYTITPSGLRDLKWYIRGKEYTEYEYWKLMCSLLCDKVRMTLSMDEARYWIETSEQKFPLPCRLNRTIKDLVDTEDEGRTQLSAHAVWSIDDQDYVPAEKFWNYWERKSYDISDLLL